MAKNTHSVICRFCGSQCHLLASTDDDNQIEKILPDPEYGTIWCHTGKNILEMMRHRERIQTPLKRTGEKGENQWKPISWEAAFEEIGERFRRSIDKYGADSFLGIRGYNKPYFNPIFERFINVIGTVNSMGAANMCHMAGMGASRETFGFAPDQAITDATRFIILWGSNPYSTDKRTAHKIKLAMKKGTRLIVIDPCCTRHAKEAAMWLPIQAGTDMLLALGLIHIIVEEGWEDREFITSYTEGYEQLQNHVRQYTPEYVAKNTGIPEKMLYDLSRIIALEGPGVIFQGNALDHNYDGFQKCRAIDILLAVTGNIDKDGAMTARPGMSERKAKQYRQIAMPDICPFNDQKRREAIVGYSLHYLDQFNESGGSDLARAICEGEPYPIRTAYILGGNPAMIWENREVLVKAFCELDFLVVTDFFMTPTAMLADIVLPAAMYPEYESVYIDGSDTVFYSPSICPESSQKSDYEIINELAKSMGYGKYFWNTMDDYWNDYLNPFDLSMEEVRRRKIISCQDDARARKSETGRLRKEGFPTDNGKIHIYSRRMEEKGNDPLPVYREMVRTTREYPYISTNYKSEFFYHTAGRMVDGQRKHEPEAVALVSGDIAEEQKIQNGDMIVVETSWGKVEQEARVVEEMAKLTVALAHGWWYPEKETSPFRLRACSNNIVPDNALRGQELPSFTTRGIPCRVYKKCREVSSHEI